MNKIILISVALGFLSISNAQETDIPVVIEKSIDGKGFSKGNVYISGAVGFTSETFGEAKNNTFTAAPTAGFFVSDKFSVGIAFGYRGMTDETEVSVVPLDPAEPITVETIEEESTTLSVGAFARYYVTPASDFSVFGQLGFNYNMTNSNDGMPLSEDVKYNGFDITFSPGISYFISNHFALEAAIGALRYETTAQDIDDADERNTFNIGLDLTDLTIGLLFKF